MKKRERGFSLAELFVVTLVIMVIAAIATTALTRARERGRMTECINNLRQLGLAMNIYTTDCNERFPVVNGPPRWYQNLYENGYLKVQESFKCPSESGHAFTDASMSYGFNYLLSGIKLGNLATPAMTAVAADSDGDGISDYIISGSGGNLVTSRHLGNATIVFVDGHVETRDADLVNMYLDNSGDANNPDDIFERNLIDAAGNPLAELFY